MGRKQASPVSIGLERELGLPEFIVTGKEEIDGDVLYTVYASKRPVCWSCGYENPAIHSTSSVYVADLPRYGQRVGLRVQKQRYTCPKCKATTPDDFTSYQGKMTVRLRERIKRETLYRPFKKISEEYGCSPTKVNELFNEKQAECARKYHPTMPVNLAIDRMPIHAGKTKYTILVDLDDASGKTVEISNAISQSAAEACLGRLNEPSRCKRVFLDLHEGYRKAVRSVLGEGVIVVVDRNHVVQALYEAFDGIRVELSKKNVVKNRNRAFAANRLLLNTDYEKLNRRQCEHLAALIENYPEFQPAYELKEAFLNIYGADNADSAKAYYQEWKNACQTEGVAGFDGFIGLIDAWYDEVFAYFDNTGEEEKITAAKAAVLKIDREGFRYKFDVLRAKILYRNIVDEPLTGMMDFGKFK